MEINKVILIEMNIAKNRTGRPEEEEQSWRIYTYVKKRNQTQLSTQQMSPIICISKTDKIIFGVRS